ncbi:MAG: hypothetical protein U1D30_00260 [Planctomycetota bacterium]
MQRQSWIGNAIAWMAGLAICAFWQQKSRPAYRCLPSGGTPDRSSPYFAPTPEPSSQELPPTGVPVTNGSPYLNVQQRAVPNRVERQPDVYSEYSDAFINPMAAAPADGQAAAALQQQIRGPRYSHIYFGADVLNYRRSRPGNKVLLRTTPNLFDNDPNQLVAPNANGADGIFGIDATPGSPFQGTAYNPNVPAARLNVDEFLVPNEVRFQTQDFDNPSRTGYRQTIGIELQSGNRIEFSYMWIEDFNAQHVDDVSGAAFRTFQISDSNTPTQAWMQRFGYLNAPFRLPVDNFRLDGQPDPFGGEARIRLSPTTPPTSSPPGSDSTAPHYPLNESPAWNSYINALGVLVYAGVPPVAGDAPGVLPDGTVVPNSPNPTTSADIPREPTNEDVRLLGATDPRYFFSLLWTDGELAVIDYDFDMQGAELAYRRNIFVFERDDWALELIGGIRYIALDEKFNFFFADVAGPETIAQNPFDRALANPDQPRAQSSAEASATYIAGIENDIIGPEVGISAKYPFLYIFELDLLGKASFAANFLKNQQAVIRGDGLELFNYSKTVHSTSGFFEGHLGLKMNIHRNISLHAGWEYLYLINIGTAINQIEFDLTRRPRPSNEEKILWSGWYGGFEVLF